MTPLIVGGRSAKTVLWIASEDQKRECRAASGPVQCECRVLAARDLFSALEIVRQEPLEAILIHSPMNGTAVGDAVSQLHEVNSELPIIVYEPDGFISRWSALRLLGAFQYISHAVPLEELHKAVSTAIRHYEGKRERESERPGMAGNVFVGESSATQEVIEIIRLVANRRSTVLITGETGTGKEVAARAIHVASNRSTMKMVAINCAALPDHLLEAELFGHTKGAFTGAVNARVGLFERAHRGTIFLDEIGEMPLQLQSKLLRVLQEREVQRIGSSEPLPVDVRVIAASNQDLIEAVAQRRFREDLYYRLNVVALRIPPLRERLSDIPELVEHFLQKIAAQERTRPREISPEALDKLMAYSWPGNVRQLEHAIESAVALTDTRTLLRPSDFDLPHIASREMGPLSSLDVPESGINFAHVIAGIERRLLERALQKSGGNKVRAANMLQMKRTTLISKFKALEAQA